MVTNVGQSAIKLINKSSFLNRASNPNTAKHLVGSLIVMNGTIRALANESDKKEASNSRHYGALVEGMHNAFCLANLYLITPFFAIGGLLLGKKVLAKTAFKDIAKKVKLAPEQREFLAKNTKKAQKSVGNFFSKIYQRVAELFKVSDADKGIAKVHEYNGTVLKTVREKLENKQQIIIQKGKQYYTIAKKVAKSITDKGRNDNILDALEGNKAVLTEISERQAKGLQERGKAFISNTLKFIGNDKTTHNNVIGSQKFGEALGMMTALTIISPVFTNKFVPAMLKKLGLDDKKGEEKTPNIYNESSKHIQNLKKDFFSSVN